MSRAIRVEPAPASRHPDDEPAIIDPGTTAASLAPAGPGRTILRHPDGRWTRATFGPARGGRGGSGGHAGPQALEVVIDGWRFELDVEPAERAELRARASRADAGGPASGHLEIRATIPGQVIAVAVNPGDTVEAAQRLLVVEAMKMQNELRAPHAGRISRIAVAAGRTVEPGDLLVVLE